jgi:hypothetical protein
MKGIHLTGDLFPTCLNRREAAPLVQGARLAGPFSRIGRPALRLSPTEGDIVAQRTLLELRHHDYRTACAVRGRCQTRTCLTTRYFARQPLA